jgi:hypothetical protein
MSASYNSNKGFQGEDFQSGYSICKSMDLNEYYGSQKGGASKKAKKPAKKSSSTKKKPAKKSSSTKKRGGSDAFDAIDKINSSLAWATQAGGTELASEYYTSAQQGSYAPYNASKDEKCGGGRKKRVVRGGIGMGQAEGIMNQKKGNMDGSMASADSATGGSCGCGYKPKTSGRKRGGGDGYYTDTATGDDPVVETEDLSDDGKLNGGAKKKRSSSKGAKKPAKAKPRSSSSKGAKKKPRKLKGGDDSAGGGSDFATTFNSWGPVNTTSVTDKAYFPIFNKSTPYMSKQDLIYCGVAPESTGCIPPSDGPLAYNDHLLGGKKKPAKKKPAKKSTSSKSKPAKKSTSSKSKAKPAKKSTSSKTKAKKH